MQCEVGEELYCVPCSLFSLFRIILFIFFFSFLEVLVWRVFRIFVDFRLPLHHKDHEINFHFILSVSCSLWVDEIYLQIRGDIKDNSKIIFLISQQKT